MAQYLSRPVDSACLSLRFFLWRTTTTCYSLPHTLQDWSTEKKTAEVLGRTEKVLINSMCLCLINVLRVFFFYLTDPKLLYFWTFRCSACRNNQYIDLSHNICTWPQSFLVTQYNTHYIYLKIDVTMFCTFHLHLYLLQLLIHNVV